MVITATVVVVVMSGRGWSLLLAGGRSLPVVVLVLHVRSVIVILAMWLMVMDVVVFMVLVLFKVVTCSRTGGGAQLAADRGNLVLRTNAGLVVLVVVVVVVLLLVGVKALLDL